MTDVELEVADSFERVFPVPLVSADWDDVLDRAEARRERRAPSFPGMRLVAVAAVISVGGLLVTPAFAIGSRLLHLIQGAQRLVVAPSPAWSPDGRKIAFVSDRDLNPGIYVMNADGSRQRRLTGEADLNAGQTWSPDGRKLAFLVPGGRVSELYVVNADGSGRRKLTRDAGIAAPAWSPDGRKLAFRSDRNGNAEIYVADGSGLRRLTRNPASDDGPAWSPDGRKIAFSRWHDGDGDVYLMNADGSGQTRLTHHGS